MLALAVGEDSRDRGTLAGLATGANAVHDNASLEGDLVVVCRLGSKGTKHHCGFFLAIFAEQPTRRLGESRDQNEHYDGEDTLEGDRESPRKLVRAVKATIIDPGRQVSISRESTRRAAVGCIPISDQSSDCDIAALNTDELSAVVRLRASKLVLAHARDSFRRPRTQPGKSAQWMC